MRHLNPQLRWFLSQLRPLLKTHLLSVLLIVVASLTFLLDPLILKWLIDVVLPKRDARMLMVAVGCIVGVYVCQLSCYAAGGVLSFQTVQKLVFSIRLKLLEQINRLSADFHETVPLGEKLYRIEQDVDQVAELGSTIVPSILQTAFTAIFVLTTMFVLNLRLTCVLLPLMPLFVFLKRQYETRLRRAADSAQEESSKENNFLQEHLSSVVQIQLLRQEETQTRAFISRARAKMEALHRRNIQEILFRTWFLGVVAIGMIAILSYGGYQVFLGALTVGGFVAFYSYLARLFAPLSAAVDIYSRLNRLNSSLRRILKIIDEKPSVCESPTAVELPRRTQAGIILEGVLFDRSIKENLLLGKADASIEELWEAVEVAGLTALIHSLPGGWDTQIGPRGMFLSGGERQRLSLARAVLQKPSVFLLDESTSALDVPSERQVYINLTHHFAEQTILFVSHRVSALTWTDRIVVLNHGVIEEEGTHDQLIETGRLYPNLFKSTSSSDGSAPLFSLSNKRSSPLPMPAGTEKSRKG